jgi:hypothetical protein
MIPIPAFAVRMKCDGPNCVLDGERAPRVLVPSLTPFAEGHRPIRVMTTLHFCARHRDYAKLSDLLNEAMRTKIEAHAKRARPIGFKPDFERASLELVLVTTPEYREFLVHVGRAHVLAPP